MKSDVIKISRDADNLNKILNEAQKMAEYAKLNAKQTIRTRLIAEEFREQLHDSASYYTAEKIAQKIQEENNKDLSDYDYRDVRNLFILGNCYKYTTSYEQSNVIFEISMTMKGGYTYNENEIKYTKRGEKILVYCSQYGIKW